MVTIQPWSLAIMYEYYILIVKLKTKSAWGSQTWVRQNVKKRTHEEDALTITLRLWFIPIIIRQYLQIVKQYA